MPHGLPEAVEVDITTRSFRRFAHVVGIVTLAAAFLSLAAYQHASAAPQPWLAYGALAMIGVALWQAARGAGAARAVFWLAAGCASIFAYALVVLAGMAAVDATDHFLLFLPKVALVFVGGVSRDVRLAPVWCLAGYVAGEAATLAAAMLAPAPARFDLATALTLLAVVVALTVEATKRARGGRLRPRLQRAALDDHRAALRYRLEVRAAALMHDTVLNHLAAVAAAPDGAVREELRSVIERDLAVLVAGEWLVDDEPGLDEHTKSAWEHSTLFAAIREATSLGLTVDVTGDVSAMGRLAPAVDAAVGLAAKQCLVNVAKHAGTKKAEIVIIGSEREVSVMVIDAGCGFVEAEVDSNRMGIRHSVRDRVAAVDGDVQIWSTPGRGTSVMIRVPVTRPVPQRREAGNG